jgi:hypothetical protein
MLLKTTITYLAINRKPLQLALRIFQTVSIGILKEITLNT